VPRLREHFRATRVCIESSQPRRRYTPSVTSRSFLCLLPQNTVSFFHWQVGPRDIRCLYMRKTIISCIGLGILAVLAVLGWWFWSLGSVSTASEMPVVRLVVEKGSVYVTKAGSSMESPATDGMILSANDRVRTDKDSLARVNVFGRAETRLDQNTTVVLDEAVLGSPTSMAVVWKIEAGRAWSRVLRLLDLDSTYEVHSDQVVATVRGTAFMVWKEKDRTGVYVDQAGVRVQSQKAADQHRSLAAGEWVVFGADAKIDPKDETKFGTWPLDGWIKDNQARDERFMKQTTGRLFDSLRATSGVGFDSALRPLADWSEGLHLGLAGKDAPELYGAYLGRKLGFVRLMIERGSSDRAMDDFSRVQKETMKKTSPSYRGAIRPVLVRALLSVSDVMPGEALYPYKVRLEEWLDAFSVSISAADGLMPPPFIVNSRLDEADRFTCPQMTKEYVQAVADAVVAAWSQEDSRIQTSDNGMNDELQKILGEKIESQKLRLDRFYARANACLGGAESPASVTSTTPLAPNKQPNGTTPSVPVKPLVPFVAPKPPVFKPVEVKPTQPATTETVLTKIEVFAQPNPIMVGDKAVLYVKGYASDGSSVDATSRAKFNLIGKLGTMVGAVFQATGAGSVTIEASVVSQSQTLTSRVTLTIQQPVTLTGLKVSTNGGAQVVQGQSVSLYATASYSNGATRDVTASVKWGLSGTAGTLSGNVFSAGANGLGTVDVMAYYGENGSDVSGSLTLEVVSTPIKAPTYLK